MMDSEQIMADISKQERTLTSYIDPILGSSVLTKRTEFYILDDLFQTQFCKMSVYSEGVVPGPLNESAIINLLFPLPSENQSVHTQMSDPNHVVFANILEWSNPSMAIFANTEMYPLKWLARVEHLNPFSEYDFSVYAMLA